MADKNAKHTLGPWSFCCDSEHSSKCMRGVQHSKKAAIHQDHGDRRTVASHVANWADARLIAAAPDLLAACKAVEAMSGMDREYGGEADDLVRAAIAKAEGS